MESNGLSCHSVCLAIFPSQINGLHTSWEYAEKASANLKALLIVRKENFFPNKSEQNPLKSSLHSRQYNSKIGKKCQYILLNMVHTDG